MKEYVDAILVLLRGAKILWTILLATSVSLATITHVVTSHNKEAERRFNESVDDALETYDHSKAVIKGDSCIYEKRLAAKEKATATTFTPKRVVASTPSARKPQRVKRTTRPATSTPKQPATSIEEPQPTVAEQHRLEGEKEGHAWSKYLNASSLTTRTPRIGKATIEGIITSTATLATYKDLVLRVQFITLTEEVLPEQVVIIPQFLSPGQSISIKVKLKAPAHTKNMTCAITGAGYLLAP